MPGGVVAGLVPGQTVTTVAAEWHGTLASPSPTAPLTGKSTSSSTARTRRSSTSSRPDGVVLRRRHRCGGGVAVEGGAGGGLGVDGVVRASPAAGLTVRAVHVHNLDPSPVRRRAGPAP